jgi:hypothetical protein
MQAGSECRAHDLVWTAGRFEITSVSAEAGKEAGCHDRLISAGREERGKKSPR